MKMKVMGENLLVKKQQMEKKTASGIVVAQQNDRHDNAHMAVQVVEVGPMAFNWEKTNKPNVCLPEKDSYILIKKYSGVNFEIGEDEFKVISDTDVLAWVDEDTVEKMRQWV